MFAEEGGGNAVGFFHFPIPALHTDDIDARGLHRVLETEPPLLAVKSRRNPFDDGGVVAAFKLCGENPANFARARAVVRADERHLQTRLLEHAGIEFVVNIDDQYAGLFGVLENGDQRLGVRRGDDNGVHLQCDHLFEQGSPARRGRFRF